jgi:hypothetical protein
VEVVRGKEIVRRYSGRHHCRCVRLGDLENSCMRYDGYEDRFEIYADVAEMAVVICPVCQGTRARALVWTDTDKKKHIDRIYGSPVMQEHLGDWAKEQKMGRLWPNTNHRRKEVAVHVPRTDYTAGPYLDSLMFWCRTCQKLSNYECKGDTHDKVLLRSTHAQGHTGWWGRCPDCHYPFTDRGRRCQNRHSCGACGTSHCTPECPHGCRECHGCGVWLRHGIACPNACVTCSCGMTNTVAGLMGQHGHCRGCGDQLQPEKVGKSSLSWQASIARWEGRCPSCEYTIRVRMTSGVPSTTEGLIECRFVHGGYASSEAGHCPSCHHVMRWDVQERPKSRTTSGGSSGRKTVHSPASWTRTGAKTYDVTKGDYVSPHGDYTARIRGLWDEYQEGR